MAELLAGQDTVISLASEIVKKDDAWQPHRVKAQAALENALYGEGSRVIETLRRELFSTLNLDKISNSNISIGEFRKSVMLPQLKLDKYFDLIVYGYQYRVGEDRKGLVTKGLVIFNELEEAIGVIEAKLSDSYRGTLEKVKAYIDRKREFEVKWNTIIRAEGIKGIAEADKLLTKANLLAEHLKDNRRIKLITWMIPKGFDRDAHGSFEHGTMHVLESDHILATMVHEIGHGVSSVTFKKRFSKNKKRIPLNDLAKQWLSITGWSGKPATFKSDSYQIEDTQGYAEREASSRRWFQKIEYQSKIRDYAHTNPEEDFAVSYSAYVCKPGDMKKLEPQRYAFMKKHVFKGTEYSRSLVKSLMTMVGG